MNVLRSLRALLVCLIGIVINGCDPSKNNDAKQTVNENIQEVLLELISGGPGGGSEFIWMNKSGRVYVSENYYTEDEKRHRQKRFRYSLDRETHQIIWDSLRVATSLRKGSPIGMLRATAPDQDFNFLYIRKEDGREYIVTEGLQPERTLIEGVVKLLEKVTLVAKTDENLFFHNDFDPLWHPKGFVSVDDVAKIYNLLPYIDDD